MKNNERTLRIQRMTYSALFLAIAMILPFFTGQIPEIGSMLCPMHIPVLLCGLVCGWPWGAAVGFVAPLLRAVTFGMPVLYPTGIAMAFELCTYGLVSGVMYHVLRKTTVNLYVSLISAMVVGRIVWGLAQFALLQIQGTAFTPAMFVAGAVTNAVPGIILHIALIPPLVLALKRTGMILND